MTKKPFVKQEVFDYVLTFLRKQGGPSMGGDGGCAYRGDEGRMCAVGCLIPDSVMDLEYNNSPVRNPKVIRMLKLIYTDFDQPSPILFSYMNFLDELQGAHDDHLGEDLDMFNSVMKGIAARHNLLYTEPA